MSKYILIITSSFDSTVDFLIEKYGKDYDFIRINLDKIYEHKISITNDKIIYKHKLKEIDLFKSIKSIYFRKIFLPELENYDKNYRNYMHKEIYNFIIGLADTFEGKILSQPSLLRKVENKVYQLSVAKKLNFLLPQSIISNDEDYVNKNIKINKWIAKPLSIGKITENKKVLTNLLKDKVSNIEFSPTYFQTNLHKDYELRITVINREFYCVKILSDLIDWRKDKNAQYQLIDIPKDLKRQCLSFLDYAELSFGAFDYIVSDDKYYFLECNPNGQWLWLEDELNLDISNKILGYLND